MTNKPVRAPASLYIVVGVLAAFGALMLVRMLMGLLFSVLTIAAVVGLIVLVVNGVARRGSR